MKIMVTGDQGYIGAVLVPMLKDKGYEVVGYDAGYFTENVLQPLKETHKKIKKDIRDVNISDLEGVDAIIHLAGLSNDPLGDFLPKLTEDINYSGTIRLAELAQRCGVSRFVYASSQSMYGISDSSNELDEDNSAKNPVTAYAIAKWRAEQKLHTMSTEKFVVTSIRPSTVFGASPRLRCDIVFNNLVACAYTTGKIEIMSDGSPWRPIVHIRDVCSAFIAGVEAPRKLVSGRAFNVGVLNGNFTVRDIAEAAQRAVPGCDLVFTGEHGSDSRTYKVGFSRILTELSDYYEPEWDLDMGGRELVEFFDEIDLQESQFRGRDTIRLKQLKHLIDNNMLGSDLRYET
jgi:nucleoside-diphosphate-sugar epimerase